MKLQGKKVMVVDDEHMLAKELCERLGDFGAEARCCHNGREAVRLLEQWHPDVILSDYKMPVSNGLDLLQVIREKKIECPVVWMSGHVDQNLYREAWRLGVYDILEKPVRTETVVTYLTAALQGAVAPSRNSQGRFLTETLFETLSIEVPRELGVKLQALTQQMGISVGQLALALLEDRVRQFEEHSKSPLNRAG